MLLLVIDVAHLDLHASVGSRQSLIFFSVVFHKRSIYLVDRFLNMIKAEEVCIMLNFSCV